MTKKSAWNKAGKRQNKNGEVEKMARKDDILSIYTREVEGIKEAGLFKGEAPFVSPQGARVKMEENFFVCVRITTLDWGITRD